MNIKERLMRDRDMTYEQIKRVLDVVERKMEVLPTETSQHPEHAEESLHVLLNAVRMLTEKVEYLNERIDATGIDL